MSPPVSSDTAPGLPKTRVTGLILGPLLLLVTVLLPAPGDMGNEAWLALGMLLLMATWWSTEAIAIPATALLPIILIPALGLDTVVGATAAYANPIIFLFMGGFVLGLALQRWNLHKRIALLTLLAVGSQPKRQIGGFMVATAFLSMWVSNTATTIMMLPIGLSVVSMMADDDPEAVRRFATNLLLAIAYAASVGGIATLIGTPPNALLAAYLAQNQGITIGFAQWMLVGVPVSLTMLAAIWFWLTRNGMGDGDDAARKAEGLREQLQALGPMSRAEKLVATVFVATAAAWICQPMLAASLLPWLNDTIIAITAAIVLFLIPVDLRSRTFLMDWDTAQGMPWGVLLLFGGGLALAGAISSSGLATWIAESLGVLSMLPALLMVALVVTVIIFLTEVTSNTATAAAFLPLLGALAVAQDLSPLLFTIPAAIAASCAFMMPVATPPNAIVFGSGHLQIGDMIRAGFALNLLGIIVVTFAGYALVGWIFGGL